MLKNYLKIAYRGLLRDRFFSLLNLFGLTSGITAFILITLFVRFELGHDKFHSKLDRIWAIETVYAMPEGPRAKDSFGFLAGQIFKENIPEIEKLVQLQGGYNKVFGIGEETFYNDSWFYTSNDFFDVFDFTVLSGSPQLDKEYAVVINESTAKKYFGDQDPIGQTIRFEKMTDLVVTAVVADPPSNSYLQFSMLLSIEKSSNEILKNMEPDSRAWSRTAHTYALLANGVEEETLKEKMIAVAGDHFTSRFHRDDEGALRFKPEVRAFGDIHLKSGYENSISATGDIRYVYLFATIAVLILVIACINYINLATARSLKRAKETGLRKVLGAIRKQIMLQYLSESVVLTSVSVILAFAIAERLLPAYNELIGRELNLSYGSIEFLVVLIGVNLIVSLMAGAYPAFKLSTFSPAEAIKGEKAPKGRKRVRRALVLVQFMIAQLLIVATIVIQSQLNYLQNKDLGYNREQLLYIDTHEELQEHAVAFRQQIMSIPGVKDLAYSDGVFTRAGITFFKLNEVEGNEDADPEAYIIADVFNGDANFAELMGIELTMGRILDRENTADINGSILINEEAAKQFGWDEPLGKQVKAWGAMREVVGVMKDFHNESLKAEITPSFIIVAKDISSFANIRISPNDVAGTMSAIEEVWDGFETGRPLEFTFYDEQFDAHYRTEQQLGYIFFIFSSLAIGISLLGLIGLTAFNAEQRLKEVGIRKVLGASVKTLILLLSSEFVWLCMIAFVIITPITYYLMDNWLEVFKYRIDVGVVVYLIALVASLGVGWVVVCFQSLKVARTNPAEVLRSE